MQDKLSWGYKDRSESQWLALLQLLTERREINY